MTNDNALVLGLGSSGEAAARLLRAEGRGVVVTDRADNEALRRRAGELALDGIEVLLGTERVPGRSFSLCVVSPGVPPESPAFAAVRNLGIPTMGELEFGAAKCRCPIVAVSGANGKSTLVKLCGDILRLAGRRAELGGNYGTPVSALAKRSEELDWLVLEASSFQLEMTRDFRPRVGVLLNLQPNHLDRHPTLEAYRAAKARLFARMGEGDRAIVHESVFTRFRAMAAQRPDQPEWVKFGRGPRCAARYEPGFVSLDAGGGRVRMSIEGTYFDNPVLGPAAAAAAAVAAACGVPPGLVAEAAKRFVPLPHRMTRVAIKRGVEFVDDSKATTLAALAAGVTMASRPVRLIAGGILKEHRLSAVKKVLASHVRAVYLVGNSAPKMYAAWSDVVPCRRCGTLDVAVSEAWRDASPGETILLSPGCASFDQFRGYADRGEQFCGHVAKIEEGVRV